MFQFRAFPSCSYLIHCTMTAYCAAVLPHSEISGSKFICNSPKLIAACHVLHRLLMPRHSPCALFSLTYVEENCAPLRPPLRVEHPLRSVSFSSSIQTRLRWALNREKKWFIFFVWFSFKNYAGSTELLNKIVFTLLKSSTIKVYSSAIFRSRPLLPCLSFLSSVQFSRCN